MAVKDTELCGVKIPAGSGVYAALPSANHDETVREEPNRFDITREQKPIMSFGMRPHSCLGQNLAKAEMTIAIASLVKRLPQSAEGRSALAQCKNERFSISLAQSATG